MSNRKYTDNEREEIAKLYPTTNTHELAKKYNSTYSAINTLARKLNVVKDPSYQRRKINSPWNEEKDNYLNQHYHNTPNPVLAKKFNTSVTNIKNRSTYLGLKKSDEYLTQNKPGCFSKGSVSWNKGKKGYMGPNATSFKKGNKPHNTKHDLCITTRTEILRNGEKRKYRWIRLSKAKWKQLSHYNWEKENPPVPEGFNLVFQDGNTMNCDISNLKLISNADHLEEMRDTDSYIAKYLSHSKGKGNVDYELKKEILKHPQLIDLKRTQIKLNKTIKEIQNGKS